MEYNFDEPLKREGTSCVKYDSRQEIFGKKDVIPMWVADMDFKCPPAVTEALRQRLKHEILGYTVRREEYFSSIKKWLRKRYEWHIENDWIVFSPGIVPALNICTLAFTEPGDKIIVQPPVYFPFFNAVTDHKRKLLFNRLKETNGQWSIDFDDLERKASQGARMLLLSSPHNPVGRSWSKEELEKLSRICLDYNILIISDEIHADLVLPGHKHIPLAKISGPVADNTLTCMAPSKTFNLAGLSTSSMIISNPGLRKKFEDAINSLHITGGNIFGTEASIAAYSFGEEWLDQLLPYIKNNIEYLVLRLEEVELVSPVIPEATYMVWLDCRRMKMSIPELNDFFINKAGVGLSEGSMFGPGGEGFMRINLACSHDTLRKAMDNIINALKSLEK
ncbi:MAG TPA: PatB family C-S lyase [Bacteroidales bacterium]|nr:PatB family C-S lyase [Bacteroidales bacterium]